MMPSGPAQSFGRGPVKVALLLPLSGDRGLASVGTSLANASRLAMAFIEANPNIAENITITLRDTGATVPGATAAASAAVHGWRQADPGAAARRPGDGGRRGRAARPGCR